jgi:hypothetical protein
MPFLRDKSSSFEVPAGLPRGTDAGLALGHDQYTPSPKLPKPAKPPESPGGRAAAALMHEVAFLQEALKRECSNLDCRQRRILSWRGRRRLSFEGKLGCKGACIDSMIKAAIVREGSAGRLSLAAAPHRHRIPLGLILLAQGWITHPQLQQALEAQRRQGDGRIGDWLVAECGLGSECVTRGLSVQWNCPVLTTDGFSAQTMALVLPRLFVKDYGILPLRIAGNKLLYLGFRDRLDASLAFAAERMSGLRIESGLVAEGEFEATRSRLLACAFPPAYGKAVPDSDALAAQVAVVLEQSQATASKLVRLHQHYWLRVWTNPGTRAVLGGATARLEDIQDFLFTIGAQA